ncbi:hypothetical protein DRO33_03050, partial [Candidatus Bathyarchaeota archaeon]
MGGGRLRLRAIDVVATALCAALYAALGYLAWLGIVCPAVGVVRFWPVVVVPAVFATLFGPLVGGLGAAIGIFVSDMLIHGDALLSLTAGVPANFICFFIVGYLGRRQFSPLKGALLVVLALTAPLAATIALYALGSLSADVAITFSVACYACMACYAVAVKLAARWEGYHVGSVLGLLAGSTWIGLTVWAYSQFFTLPAVVKG